MEQDKLLEQLSELVENLGFDYDRMSQSGQETYDMICYIVHKLTS